MISVENLTKRFGAQVLYHNASFSLGERERIGLIGPNGAGKSTFFKILTQKEDVDQGKVHIPNHYRILLMEQEWLPETGDLIVESGLKVFESWHQAFSKLKDLEERLAQDPTHMKAYEEAQDIFLSLGGYHVEHELKEILSGLGFKDSDWSKETSSLSGGWRMRVYIAGLLIQKADLLLLDEPTNYLDIDSVIWFEQFIMDYPNSMMIISHDRRMIDRVSKKILEFSPPKMTLWPYGLKKFESSKAERMLQLENEITHKKREIEKLQTFAKRFGAKASKARQAQSKLKSASFIEDELIKLKEQMPLESSRHSQFKISLDKRQPKICVEINQGVFGYDTAKPLFSIEKVAIESGNKLGIIGDNGIGKTTFLRSIAGELPLLAGTLNVHSKCDMSLFSQHRMEELPAHIKALDYLSQHLQHHSISMMRGIAASLGLNQLDLDKPIEVLSGGEKARLSLARILMQKPDILLLDEPTNHLDLHACDSLIEGISDYQGTVIVVSHNRDFLDAMVNQVYHFKDGRVDIHEGSYSDFVGRDDLGVTSKEASTQQRSSSSQKKSKEAKRLEAQARQDKSNQAKSLKADIQTIESEIQDYKIEIREIDEFLIKPDKQGSRLFSEKLKNRKRLEEKLEKRESQWLKKNEALENMKG